MIEVDAGRGGLVDGAVAVVGHLGVDVRGVDRNILPGIGQRRDGVDRRIIGDDHAHRLQALGIGHGREQHAQLLTCADAAVAAVAPERFGDGADLVGRGAEIVQHARDGIAFLGHDHPFVEGIAAGRLIGGLRQQRDVLRYDARFETGIGVRVRRAGIGQLDAGNAGCGGQITGGFRAPIGGLLHACQSLRLSA